MIEKKTLFSFKDIEDSDMEHSNDSDESDVNSDTDSDELSSDSELNDESSSFPQEEEEDPVIKCFIERQNLKPNKPASIASDDPFITLCFHPSNDIICMGCVSGNMCFYSYSDEENKLLGEVEVHLKACRTLEFSKDGLTIFSGGRDKVIGFVDVNTFDMKMFIEKAHDVAISDLKVVDDNAIVSGGDDGVIKIWDTRNINKPAFIFRDISDYISDINIKDSHKIACSSGDGTLTCFDMRINNKVVQTVPYHCDLTSCCSTHNETVIVCGTFTGDFLFHKWNDLTEIAGTYKPRRKKDINCLLSVSENIVLAGMDDGNIRAYHFYPNKEIGIVGQHDLNVETLDISYDGSLVASLSPDPIVKFWNISYLEGFELNLRTASVPREEVNLPSSEYEDRRTFFSDFENY